MSDPVYVYYDINGNVSEWVVSDDVGYSPSERPGMARVSVLRADYDTCPSPLNVGGIAACHSLNKICVAALTLADPVRGAKCQANITALDAQIVANAQATAKAQADSLAAWNALTPAARQAALDADALLGVGVIPVGP